MPRQTLLVILAVTPGPHDLHHGASGKHFISHTLVVAQLVVYW